MYILGVGGKEDWSGVDVSHKCKWAGPTGGAFFFSDDFGIALMKF